MLIVLGIMAALSSITMVGFVSYQKSQSLSKDTETVIETLAQARNQTISSKNASSYGVYFASTAITLFTGTMYSSANPNNQIFNLTSGNVVTVSLTGGGSSIIFNRITGETDQPGIVNIVSSVSSTTIQVYKTGIIE